MTLFEGIKDGVYLVKRLNFDEKIAKDRLSCMGVKAGSKVTVLNKKETGGLIIQLDNKQIGLCRNFADGIEIEEVS
ncbi:MAG: ferrous iron transport protein A [Butyrivibrio sp.]|nr:ferrous iron transport protein A [Butyrivibrio sp.]